jgi:membrane protein involved in colicin uptake
MARKSLRPQLNQIRAWVRQGRTDAWVAHQLEVTVQEIEQFKRQNDLEGNEEVVDGAVAGDYPEEIDLRAEDDALIAAELEEAARKAEEEAKAKQEAAESARAEREARRAARARTESEDGEDGDDAGDADEDQDDEDADEGEGRSRLRTRRRGRRGGRARRGSTTRASGPLEGTFDHGEEGYGLWLDPAVQDNPVYAEHWAGHRSVEVTIEEDQIVIRRVGADD